ncbi:hypothetical protein ACSBR2_040134 [Camellia fascicularis]
MWLGQPKTKCFVLRVRSTHLYKEIQIGLSDFISERFRFRRSKTPSAPLSTKVLNAGKNKLKSMDEVRSLLSLRALILNDYEIVSICRLDQLKELNTLDVVDEDEDESQTTLALVCGNSATNKRTSPKLLSLLSCCLIFARSDLSLLYSFGHEDASIVAEIDALAADQERAQSGQLFSDKGKLKTKKNEYILSSFPTKDAGEGRWSQKFVSRTCSSIYNLATASEDVRMTDGTQASNVNVQEADPNEVTYAERLTKIKGILSGETSIQLTLQFLYSHNKSDLLILKRIKQSVEPRNSVCHSATIYANAIMHAGTTVDTFLRENLDWLGKATNWAKFSATAGLSVIHRGHLQQGRSLMAPYLPQSGAGGGGSPYSEGGALYALGLIHANHGEGIKQFLRDSLCSTNVEVIQHGACLGLGLAALGTADEDIYDDVKTVLYTDSAVCGFLFEPCTYILSEAVNFVRNQLRQHRDVQLVRRLEEQLWTDVHKIMSASSLLIWGGQIGKVCLVQKENFVYELGQAFATIGIVSLGVWMSSLLSA